MAALRDNVAEQEVLREWGRYHWQVQKRGENCTFEDWLELQGLVWDATIKTHVPKSVAEKQGGTVETALDLSLGDILSSSAAWATANVSSTGAANGDITASDETAVTEIRAENAIDDVIVGQVPAQCSKDVAVQDEHRGLEIPSPMKGKSCKKVTWATDTIENPKRPNAEFWRINAQYKPGRWECPSEDGWLDTALIHESPEES
jgi:hypothetical protein